MIILLNHMSKVISFLDLIRIKNLIIITATQLLIKFSLINPLVKDISLSDNQFYTLVLATIFITASGYIINDIYDVVTDTINKDEKRVIGKAIESRNAFLWYLFFNLVGIFSGFYVAYQIDRIYFGFIFIYCTFSLWSYSKHMKTSLLLGNIQVSILTALSILNVALFDIIPNGYDSQNTKIIVFKIILCYAGFAFLTTLIREIIKDIEDIEGDKQINAKTLVIKYGIKKTKWISLSLTLITLLGVSILQYYQYIIIQKDLLKVYGINNFTFCFTILIQSLLLFLCWKIYYSKIKKDFKFISQLCKVIMIIGILSIPFLKY